MQMKLIATFNSKCNTQRNKRNEKTLNCRYTYGVMLEKKNWILGFQMAHQ